MRRYLTLFLFFLCLTTGGCAATKPLPNLIYLRPIYPIDSYPTSAETFGVKAAVYPFAPGRDVYADPRKPAESNGGLSLNVLEAGVMPIRLILLNDSDGEILFDPDQIRGMAGDAAYRTYSPQEYEIDGSCAHFVLNTIII